MIHNLITSRAVPEIVTRLGGTPVRTRVGHSYIKATMAETDAIFGGEHSGHFYFRDFWRADSGMLAALHALAALAETDAPALGAAGRVRPLPAQRRDQLRRSPTRRPRSARIEATYGARDGRRASTASTASPSATPTGPSTSAPPTPSRCCGSTSRAATRPPWRAVRDEVLALIREDDRMSTAEHARDPRRLLEIIVCPADHGDLTLVGVRRGRRADLRRAAGWPTRCATASPSCWSTKPASPA